MEDIKKETKTFDNSMFKERFQFILSINDNIICQRYFKINGFTSESLNSKELLDTLRRCVNLIKDDLTSKSRIYMWYTNKQPLKLTGFATDKDSDYETLSILTNDKCVGEVITPDGKVYNKTYFEYPEREDDFVDEKPQDNEFIFKFAFLIDDVPVFEELWDGNVYPKYVRNGVDLSNSDAAYRGKDPSSLYFSLAIVRHLTYGRKDLMYYIIRDIQEVCSSAFANKYGEYTKKMTFKSNDGNEKSYNYSTYNQNVVKGWRKATEAKTRQYETWVNYNYSPKYLEYIDNVL